MKRIIMKISISFLLFLTGMFFLTSCTGNWNQFRGPGNNMVAKGKDLPAEWGEDKNVSWTFEVSGESWSSPVVWGNRVFIASAIPVKVALASEDEDRSSLDDVYRWELSCVDFRTGKEMWNQVAYEGNPRIKKHSAHNYSGETPVTDGKRVYAYFGMTGLFCYNMEGVLQWKKDLGAYNTLNEWGTGSSPVLYKNRLYVQVDNEEQSFLVALDAGSGKEIWRVDRDEKTNYSTPMIWKNSVRTELVTGGKKSRAYDPETGELYWELNVEGRFNIPSPVANRDYLYLGNTGQGETLATLFAVRAGAEGDITPKEGELNSGGVVWSIVDAPLGNPSPLLHNGLLYLVSTRGGEITCLDAANGAIIYQETIEKAAGCWASPWVADNKIHFIDEKGVTTVIRAGREFEQLHQNKLDDKFWASVAVSKNAYLFKGANRLYCVKK